MKEKKGRAKKIIFTLIVSVILALAFSILAGAVYIDRYSDRELDMSMFVLPSMNSVTRFYYMDSGQWREWEEARIYGSKNFEYVAHEDIPEDLINAFVAIEDKRFFKHNGVDWYRTFAAGANYVLGFSDKFGASTITQQLIKNITGNDEVSISRKAREIGMALKLEENMSKEEILELYLNVINLSDHCYGVRSASRRYFSKDVKELSLLECVCIAAITNNPSYYNPINHPESNKYRRDVILLQMLDEGMITQEEFDENYEKDVLLSPDTSNTEDRVTPWYADMAIEDVISDLTERYGYTSTSASRLVYGGGLEIYLCMDMDIQKIMDGYYKNTSNFVSGEGAESSMIIIDPKNGDVLGVIGSIGEKTGNRIQNFATQTKRPPGSAIKPISVYAPALENGKITYASIYDDTPVKFTELSDSSYSLWPKNANGVYHGLSTMSYAVSNSTNTVALKVLEDVGLSHSFYFLRDKLGLSDLIEKGYDPYGNSITDMNYAALGLGQLNYGINVRDITSAYSIFADDGKFHSSRSYISVKDSYGNDLLENTEISEQVISNGNSEIMTELLREVAFGGTADGLTIKNTVAVACKTGTSQENKDRWCIGYTPSLICGVWYGYEYPKEIPRSEKNIFLNAFDGVLSGIYENGIRSAEEDREFEKNAGLTEVLFCMDSGMLPTDACKNDARMPRVKKGYFVSGTEPKEECHTHVLVDYDAICGGIATECTPAEHIRQVGMINVERSFPQQIIISDAQYVYRRLPSDMLPSFYESKAFFSVMESEKNHFGISDSEKQFNRLSTDHIVYSDIVFRRKFLR